MFLSLEQKIVGFFLGGKTFGAFAFKNYYLLFFVSGRWKLFVDLFIEKWEFIIGVKFISKIEYEIVLEIQLLIV